MGDGHSEAIRYDSYFRGLSATTYGECVTTTTLWLGLAYLWRDYLCFVASLPLPSVLFFIG